MLTVLTVSRPDLADRALEAGRRREETVWQEFDLARPRLLGGSDPLTASANSGKTPPWKLDRKGGRADPAASPDAWQAPCAGTTASTGDWSRSGLSIRASRRGLTWTAEVRRVGPVLLGRVGHPAVVLLPSGF
jgi:hypothetical protein